MANASTAPRTPQLNFPALTAMTFNLLYASGSHPADDSEAGTWAQRRPLVRQITDRHQPDIIAFQEVQEMQLADLANDLTEYHMVAGPRNGDDRAPQWSKYGTPLCWTLATVLLAQKVKAARALGGASAVLGVLPLVLTWQLKRAKGRALEDGGHCPIFLRRERWEVVEEGAFWISHTPDEPESLLPGTWLPRICHWVEIAEKATGARLQVFNTHLDWWFLARSRGGRILGEQMNKKWNGTPQILLGDFNAPRYSATWRQLINTSKAKGNWPLCDVHNMALVTSGPDDTFHGGSGETSYPGRIDHILTRPGAKTERLVIETHHDGLVYPSDHFPLIAQLRAG